LRRTRKTDPLTKESRMKVPAFGLSTCPVLVVRSPLQLAIEAAMLRLEVAR
jgi:hypothetical protein